jgi:hypothetical protein
MQLEPGVHRISAEDYHADPCPEPSLSRSIIKLLVSKTPRHAWMEHPRLNPNYKAQEAEKFDIGHAAHSVFLEGEDVVVVVKEKDWKKDVAKAARDEARKAGRVPLLPPQYESVMEMVGAADGALYEWEGRGLQICDGESELTHVWKERNGVWCRIRPDWRFQNLALDYKSTAALADPLTYNRIAVDTGLHIQDSFYRRGILATLGQDTAFVFMIQEINPPYLCSFMEIDTLMRDMGDSQVEWGIKRFGECLKKNHWPGYGNLTHTIEAPPWSLAAWELRKGELAA